MPLDFLRATIEGDRMRAAAALGATIPEDWPGDAPVELWEIREREGVAQIWGACAVILRETSEMIGHAGYHLPPGNEDIDRWAPGAVEIGYTIFEAHRRLGYASEAVRALVDWARTQGVNAVLATTAEDNLASRTVLQRSGFTHRGQIDGDEGIEDVWLHESIP
jgi:[ribosomal protein S5]-alanine N-acetyltransferase